MFIPKSAVRENSWLLFVINVIIQKNLKTTENKKKKRLANEFASRSLPLQPDAP